MVLWLNLKWRDKWQPLWLFTAPLLRIFLIAMWVNQIWWCKKSESIRANCIWWKVVFSPAPILVYFLWHFSTCHIRIEEIWRTISHAKNASLQVGSSNILHKILLEKWQIPQLRHCIPHLSKRPSDLKQNGTQEKTPFPSPFFNILSHGVVRFVASISSKNIFWLVEVLWQPIRELLFNGFWS